MTKFEGREVDYTTVKVKAGAIPTEELKHHGAEFYVLQHVTVEDIQHPIDKDGRLERRQVATPVAGWIVDSLTAAQMIDAVEPPKLPGTERAYTEALVAEVAKAVDEFHNAVPEGTTVTISTGAERVTLTKPVPDIAGLDIIPETGAVRATSGSQESGQGPAPDAAVASDESTAQVDAGPSSEPNLAHEGPAGEGDPAPDDPAAPRPSTMGQRQALARQIAQMDEKLSNEYLTWARNTRTEVVPEHMTFAEAKRTLIYMGDRDNSEAE